MKVEVSKHNSKVLKAGKAENVPEKRRGCRDKSNYQAKVDREDNNQVKTYTGMTGDIPHLKNIRYTNQTILYFTLVILYYMFL